MIAGWTDFFEAQVAAAAALAGLVFVALSINLERILSYSGLVGRAAEALMLLVQPVFIGLAVLQNGQSLRVVGIEVAAISVILIVAITRILITSGWPAARGRPHNEFAARCTLVGGALVPGVVAAALLISGNSDGFYAQSISTGMCLAAGIADAWVLLVEIMR
jgi:hypothetical protein